MRVIAVDWSGDIAAARKHIWLAEARRPGELTRLEAGRDRHELLQHLLTQQSYQTVIGFDFAFSFPAWFIAQLGIRTPPELWAHVASQGETWLAACQPPFWGHPGRPRPPVMQPYRRADQAVPRTGGVMPKSIFQIGGAGAVGTGSIRGMPLLHQLHTAGARIWPLTDGAWPVVVEIYPRLMTGAVNKSNPIARAELLARRFACLDADHRRLATASEDAFDAAVSALTMIEYVGDLASLPAEPDPILHLEGRIWHPHWR